MTDGFVFDLSVTSESLKHLRIERQRVFIGNRPRIVFHEPFDLCGVLGELRQGVVRNANIAQAAFDASRRAYLRHFRDKRVGARIEVAGVICADHIAKLGV